jgi:protein-L-isoaspartate O-methyltransferase
MKTPSYPSHRTPAGVLDAIELIITDKVVCELGCAEGDNMVFMAKYARRVIGIDRDEQRVREAQRKGLDVVRGDYHLDNLPEAEVYYFWPKDGAKDDAFLVEKILSNDTFQGIIVIGADPQRKRWLRKVDVSAVRKCIDRWGGRLIEVPLERENGAQEAFLLGVIDRSETKSVLLGTGHGNLKICSYAPCRTPMAVSEAIEEIIKGKVVCELGSAEGDNMVFMARYARKVIGFEYDERRYRFAKDRGLHMVIGDYYKDELPQAEVYYFWPNNGPKDNDFLVSKIFSNDKFNGTVVVGADPQLRRHFRQTEAVAIRKLIAKWGGRLIQVPFNEGDGDRQSGTFLVGVINKAPLPIAHAC